MRRHPIKLPAMVTARTHAGVLLALQATARSSSISGSVQGLTQRVPRPEFSTGRDFVTPVAVNSRLAGELHCET